jgi:23S rRNA (uracil1939-C5)-methyltransferase
LRLAERAEVLGVEQDEAALLALDKAFRSAPTLRRIKQERRDLFRRPLLAPELENFDAIVFDPPRAGAQAQAEEIAKSNVARIVAVSCNPITFARDAKTLIAGGYSIERVTPVDQFRGAAHVELVAFFTKTKTKKKRSLLSR